MRTQEQIKKNLQEVNKEFNENSNDFSAVQSGEDGFAIHIEWGDWKHEHAYADYVMRKHGFEKTDETLTEDDGSDCYSSIHYYKAAR